MKEGDFQNRAKEFNAEFIALQAKYKVGILAVPYYAQNEQGHFVTLAKVNLFDDIKPKEAPEPPGEKIEGGLAKPEE